MISIVASVHKRDIRLWLKSLSAQTANIEVVLVVYDDNLEVPICRQSDNGFDGGVPFPIKVINVDRVPGAYPEAWLKNIGIRNASCDIVCCTNIDILYTANFFQAVEDNCHPGVLVQATRFNIPEGAKIIEQNGAIHVSTEGQNMTIICQPMYRQWLPIIGKASGDCQCLHRKDWEDLRGYNEKLTGWGGLDTDLECRVLLSGRSICQLGFASGVVHYHVGHPQNKERILAEGAANGEIIKQFLESDLQIPNETWGEYGRETSHTDIPML